MDRIMNVISKVAWMKRCVIREYKSTPDSASLHPGYVAINQVIENLT